MWITRDRVRRLRFKRPLSLHFPSDEWADFDARTHPRTAVPIPPTGSPIIELAAAVCGGTKQSYMPRRIAWKNFGERVGGTFDRYVLTSPRRGFLVVPVCARVLETLKASHVPDTAKELEGWRWIGSLVGRDCVCVPWKRARADGSVKILVRGATILFRLQDLTPEGIGAITGMPRCSRRTSRTVVSRNGCPVLGRYPLCTGAAPLTMETPGTGPGNTLPQVPT